MSINEELKGIVEYLGTRGGVRLEALELQQFTFENHEVLVPEMYGTRGRNSGRERPDPFPELVAVFNAYNTEAPNDIRAVGNAHNYRMIPVDGWHDLHYQFTQRSKMIVELCVRRTAPPTILPRVHKALSDFHDKTLANGQVVLVWEPDFRDTGRLAAKFPLETPPETVAAAMRELISLTRAAVDTALIQHTS
ncbi:MAG: hypothetical protein WA239_19040 [Candidatus Sulfotelmatobacter sp.]